MLSLLDQPGAHERRKLPVESAGAQSAQPRDLAKVILALRPSEQQCKKLGSCAAEEQGGHTGGGVLSRRKFRWFHPGVN